MSFLDLFRKKEQPEIEEEVQENKQINIIIENLEGSQSAERIAENVKNGDIVFIKIKDIQNDNIDELKDCVAKLRASATNVGGDIAGVGNDFVIVTPANIAISRGG